MAQRSDAERGREIVQRWCDLAEKRLDYLIELQESGRWRRFHTEAGFLENIREAEAAVAVWRGLATREASLDNRPVDFSWLGQGTLQLAQREIVKREACTDAALAAPTIAAPAITVASEAPLAPEPVDVAAAPVWPQPIDFAALQERYPLLRSAL